jgi:hypothetical protein
LLPTDQAAALQFSEGHPSGANRPDARDCEWQGTGYGASVIIFGDTPIDRGASAGNSQPYTIEGSTRAASKRLAAGGVCSISMAVTEASSVDVQATAQGGQTRACQLAGLLAKAVEPNLPKN